MMVGWYPGGRGYRAPYGANNPPNPINTYSQFTCTAVLSKSPLLFPVYIAAAVILYPNGKRHDVGTF